MMKQFKTIFIGHWRNPRKYQRRYVICWSQFRIWHLQNRSIVRYGLS